MVSVHSTSPTQTVADLSESSQNDRDASLFCSSHNLLKKQQERNNKLLQAMTNSIHTIDKTIEEQAKNLMLSDPDLQEEANLTNFNMQADDNKNDLKKKEVDAKKESPKPVCPYRFVPLRMGGGGRTHVPSAESKKLVREEVTLQDLQKMTELFYDKAFQDETLDKFIRSHDDPHGPRFAKWIHSKLSGSNVWEKDRASRSDEPVEVAGGRRVVVHDRTSAHAAAWYSPKRPRHEVGRHFELDECRVWMRLHFWAMRESGIMEKSPSFADYYVRFIGHFVRVYEGTAPMFARESFRWSQDPSNIDRYIRQGRRMNDVLGVDVHTALQELPESESQDYDWPYHVWT